MSVWLKDGCSGTFYVSKGDFGTTRIIPILNLFTNLFIEISFSSIDLILFKVGVTVIELRTFY